MASGETETHQQKHARLARRLLDQADHELMACDLLQSSEKLWGATLYAVKALRASRGWECADNDRAQPLNLMQRFAAEKNDETIKLAFLIASHCHANSQYDWMEFDDLDENRVRIRQLVEKILADVE